MLRRQPTPEPPRKSGRKRVSTVDSEGTASTEHQTRSAPASRAPSESPELESRFFAGKTGRGASSRRGVRQAEAGRTEDGDDGNDGDDIDEADEADAREERRIQAKIQQDIEAKERREEQAAHLDPMQVEPDPDLDGMPMARSGATTPALLGDEDMLSPTASPPPADQPVPTPAQQDDLARMEQDDDDDVSFLQPRPNVVGGGPPLHQTGVHTRFPLDGGDNRDIILDDSDPSQATPQQHSASSVASGAPPVVTEQIEQIVRAKSKAADITLDDDDDVVEGEAEAAAQSVKQHAPAQPSEFAAPSSAAMQPGKSTSSEQSNMTTSTSSSSGSDARRVESDLVHTATKPVPPAGSQSAAVGFAPRDPDPTGEQQLQERRQRERAQEAEQRKLREQQEAMDVEPSAAGVNERMKNIDDCWILTFDSLGASHHAVGRRLAEYLVREAQAKLGRQDLTMDAWRQANILRVDVPQQPNTWDCGLYLLHYVEVFLSAPDHYLNLIAADAHHTKKRGRAPVTEEIKQLWRDDEAQSKRTVMREQVKSLMDEWRAYIEPIRAKEREAKEERRRQKLAAARASEATGAGESVEATPAAAPAPAAPPPAPSAAPPPQQQDVEDAGGDVDMFAVSGQHSLTPPLPPAADARATAAGDSGSTHTETPEPPNRARTRGGKGKGKAKAEPPTVVDLLSDDQSSTSGSPRKSQNEQVFPPPEAEGDEDELEESAPVQAPEPKPTRAMYGHSHVPPPDPQARFSFEHPNSTSQIEAPLQQRNKRPASDSSPPASRLPPSAAALAGDSSAFPADSPYLEGLRDYRSPPIEPGPSALGAPLLRQDAGEDDELGNLGSTQPQSPVRLDGDDEGKDELDDDAPLERPDPKRPKKRVKTRHSTAPTGAAAIDLERALGPQALPASVEAQESSEDEAPARAEGGKAASQELFGPSDAALPPSAQLPPARATRSSTKNVVETVLLSDGD
ncbi:hypothetical protein Rhopal_007234-T1 [Rhodotorula paludigena]|uniref:Ubiquitin-like protease family profile domain-containing protein n=1 Tax=Rhodotorula paludigena TaxID=86838 RepID=A0AAV5GNK5_9BASI|nr:hypothetical protein Rhopal_007234-T1 [Rhodotorula paludigena]